MSQSLVIVTPRLIRRHNVRCAGRAVLWGLGAGSVFLVIFLFFWVLVSLFTGERALTRAVVGGAFFFGVGLFLLGHFHLKKKGPQDWERIAQKPDRQAGMRLSRLSKQDYGQVGQGLFGLFLSGPEWLGRIAEEWRSVIPATLESAEELESLRQHLAAREAWVPIADFSKHEEGIALLTRLNLLAIRELAGEWHFHVTVQGVVPRGESTR